MTVPGFDITTTPGFNEVLHRQRERAREVAVTALQLCADDLAKVPEAARPAFLEYLRDYAVARLPPPTPIVPATARQEMTEQEAIAFEREMLPFGAYQQVPIDAMMATRAGRHYLAWVADQRFIDRLRLYLRRPDIQRELPDALDDEEEQ